MAGLARAHPARDLIRAGFGIIVLVGHVCVAPANRIESALSARQLRLSGRAAPGEFLAQAVLASEVVAVPSGTSKLNL